jgi:hypothetical protein
MEDLGGARNESNTLPDLRPRSHGRIAKRGDHRTTGHSLRVHPAVISARKRQLLGRGAAELFDTNEKLRKQLESRLDELYQQIGRLKVENDFWARKLGS